MGCGGDGMSGGVGGVVCDESPPLLFHPRPPPPNCFDCCVLSDRILAVILLMSEYLTRCVVLRIHKLFYVSATYVCVFL